MFSIWNIITHPSLLRFSIDAIQSFVSIVKDTGDSPDMNDNGTPLAPPSTPTEVKGSGSVGDGLSSAEKVNLFYCAFIIRVGVHNSSSVLLNSPFYASIYLRADN